MAAPPAIDARTWPRRLAGWSWLSGWAVVLIVFHAPWSDLGGLVAERVRWLERFLTGLALILGSSCGSWGRQLAQSGRGWSHARFARWAWFPPATLAAASLIGLELAGRSDLAGVAVNAFLGWWAGLDLGMAAWPLAHGLHYSFGGAIRRDPPRPDEADLD